jgi:vitamin B12 transporter
MKRIAVVSVVVSFAAVASADDPPADKPATDQSSTQPQLEKEIVVVASRREEPAADATQAIKTFGVDDFDRRRPFSIADVLRETPGAFVSPDGPPGQFTRVFLRGAASNQTLVLVDGIPQNDATAGGLFDFGDLGMTGVERVEVLRGSYSVLYGSEAIGGVVEVTTRRGHGPLSGYALAEYGSFGTRREEVGVSAGDRRFDFAVAAGDSATDGPRDREAFAEHDAVGRFGVAFTDTLRIDGSLRVADSRVESPYDFATSGVLPKDDDIGRRRETTSGGGTLTWDASQWLTVRATGSAFDVWSRFKNGPDDAPDGRDELDAVNAATDLRGRLEATATFARQTGEKRKSGVGVDATFGGEYLDQRSVSTTTSPNFGAPGSSTTRSNDTTRTKSGFVQANARLPDFGTDDAKPVTKNAVVTAGLRRDLHSEFGGENSPYVGARVDVLETTLRSSYGEGFRAPKPSELFDPFVGDPNLGPETSKSIDVGASRRFLDGRLMVGVTWFRLRVEDLIAYDASTFKLANFSRTETTGMEYETAADLGRGFDVRGSLTSQNPRDLDTGKPLANRPRTFGSAGVQWRRDAWRVSLDGFFSGKDRGQGGEFTAPDGDERGHPGRRTTVDLTASWQASEKVLVFAGVRNVLNDKWVATPNSPESPGIGAFAGVQLDF